LLSIFKTKKFGLVGFVIAVALIGSDTDSAGLLYAIQNYIPFYKILIRGITLIVSFFCAVRIFVLFLRNRIRKDFIYWYYIPFALLSVIIVLISASRGAGIIVALSELIWLGIPFFFIWTYGSIKQQSDKPLLDLILYQATITIIILLLGPYVKNINGASYAYIIGTDYWSSISDQVINAGISLGNFNKHNLSVLKFAQYHNPNSLGVYSAVFLATALNLILVKKNKKNVKLALFLLFIGLIGWFNSLTRGPIFIVSLVILVYLLGIIIRPKTYKRLFILFFVVLIGVLNVELIIKIGDYLLVDSSNISFVSRLDGYFYAFDVIVKNPITGIAPGFSDPIPHLLPLKIGAYYGLPAAILITVPFLHLIFLTIRVFIKDILTGESEKSIYPSMLASIIVGAYLTNGVVVYVLFWVLLSHILQKFGFVYVKKSSVTIDD
jgi:hypothetical protein